MFLFVSLMEKWSSRGRALEHSESSGTKIMMSGPTVCSYSNKDLFQDFFLTSMLFVCVLLLVYYLSEAFMAHLETFWS